MSVRPPGVLWVCAPGPESVPPETPVLGVTLARRIAVAAERAGFSRILFFAAPGLAGALAGTRAERVGTSPLKNPPAGPARLVLLRCGVVPTTAWLRAVLSDARDPDQRHGTTGTAAVFDVARVDEAVERLAGSGAVSPDGVILPGASNVAGEEIAGPCGAIELSRAADLPEVERRLLQSLIKDTEGFFSRHINRRISLALTRRLARTAITPNAMTAVSVAVGLVGAGFFQSRQATHQFAGSVFFLGHSILDGCDGELARLKFQESRLGGVFDFWGDNVVHSAVFACLAFGWSRDAGDARPLAAGALAIAGTLLSAGFVARHSMGGAAAGPQFTSVTRRQATRLSRLADMLARRDFIYFVVLLSAFGKARWFLALAAVGAPLFFLTLLAIEASGRRFGRELP